MVKRQNLHFLQFQKFRQLFRLVNKSGVKFFPSVFTHRAWASLTFVDLRWRFLFLKKLPNSILQQKYRHCMDIAKLGKPTNMYKVGNLLLLISPHCTLMVYIQTVPLSSELIGREYRGNRSLIFRYIWETAVLDDYNFLPWLPAIVSTMN